jgi:hypothetical protein
LVNAGEQDEPLLIEKLASLRGTYVIPFGKNIVSVAAYDGTEYPCGVKKSGISKAPTKAKRDVLINGKGYSLKSTRAARTAIVNHTTREKWIRVCDVLDLKMDMLDEMVSEYWELRIGGKIAEDINTTSTYCPFGNNPQRKKYLKTLINYFLFDGSGSKESHYPAEYVLKFTNPSDPSTWKIFDRQSAFDAMWPEMVFSMRSEKGMPRNYPNISDAKKKAMIEPWAKYVDGGYRGSLHIRTK